MDWFRAVNAVDHAQQTRNHWQREADHHRQIKAVSTAPRRFFTHARLRLRLTFDPPPLRPGDMACAEQE
jgi:hypothetical protein